MSYEPPSRFKNSSKGHMMGRCEHTFTVNKDGEVVCTKCGGKDDEMDQVDSD